MVEVFINGSCDEELSHYLDANEFPWIAERGGLIIWRELILRELIIWTTFWWSSRILFEVKQENSLCEKVRIIQVVKHKTCTATRTLSLYFALHCCSSWKSTNSSSNFYLYFLFWPLKKWKKSLDFCPGFPCGGNKITSN